MNGHKRPESVLVVVHDADGGILLLKRSDIDDFWQSVTGSLRWGEDPHSAALRELKEETGILAGTNLKDWDRTATYRIIDQFRSRYAPGTEHNLEHLFSCEVDRGEPVRLDPGEHVAWEWARPDAAMDKVWSWSNRDAISALARSRGWPVRD